MLRGCLKGRLKLFKELPDDVGMDVNLILK
jgi:hypothetical protein